MKMIIKHFSFFRISSKIIGISKFSRRYILSHINAQFCPWRSSNLNYLVYSRPDHYGVMYNINKYFIAISSILKKQVFIFYIILSINAGLLKSQDCGGICNEDILVGHLAAMEVLSPESIFSLAFDNVEQLCKKLEVNLRSTDSYLKNCKPSDQTQLYVSLIRGVKVLNNKLCCIDNNFYRRYNMFHSCLKELTNDFESCNGPADWNEELVKEKLCRTYKNIVDCYYIKAAKVCGKDAAKAVTELVEDVIDSVLGTRCSGLNSFPVVRDAMPEKYIKQNGSQAGSLYSVKLTLVHLIILLCVL